MSVSLRRLITLSLLLSAICVQAASSQTASLITSAVDSNQRVVLRGNVHPLVKSAIDEGEADSSANAGRLLLVLKPSAESQLAMRQYLLNAHTPGSANYHQWLTPQEFGLRFGASKSDIEQLKGWLQSQGLTISRVLAGQLAIEFTGSTGQVASAFHTSIHSFNLSGETHHANVRDPEIPAAFANIVAGVTALNDFRPRPASAPGHKALYNTATRKATAQWTTSSGGAPYYLMSPSDFATQYDIKAATLPTAGTGQIIGIINDSNIDVSVANAYRSLYGLSVNPPQVVIDGTDPGITDDAGEAYLDVENAGAVAQNATIRLYTAGSYGLLGQGGVLFSLVRAIEDNDAAVLSFSFGACEQSIGDSTNAAINLLMAQAAAQGQTVLVSSGDSGSAGCDHSYETAAFAGLGVNGLASTPWNIAVGGTDLYYSDYASGGVSIANYWNATNTKSYGSLQKQVPEQVWNNSVYGDNIELYDSLTDQQNTIAAGGGGASSCVTTSTDASGNVTCLSGYAKPQWQTGLNVPADGVRDIPDVSLFASNGVNGTGWPVCSASGDCIPDSSGNVSLSMIGGTSASTPAMAGIMAMVNQQYGRQGQANFVLYPLATKYPSVFNPVLEGSNNVLCDSGTPNCTLDTNGDGYYSLQGYAANSHYSLAAGLGSVDVTALLNYWSKISFNPSTTSLTLSSNNITHGENVNVSVSVTSTSGGTPSGSVALVSNTALPNNQGVASLTLGSQGTATGAINYLPGGTYTLMAEYSGDGTFSASDSSATTITVNPEPSVTTLTAEYTDLSGTPVPISSGDSLPFGTKLYLDTIPQGKSGSLGIATGTVAYTDAGATLGKVALSGGGTAEYTTNTLTIGSHRLAAAYSGDASYNASTSAGLVFNVVKSDSFTFFEHPGYFDGTMPLGQDASFTVAVMPSSFGPVAPTGTATFTLSNGTTITSQIQAWNGNAYATADFGSGLAAGSYTVTETYSGDSNYNSTDTSLDFTIAATGLLSSTTTLAITSPKDLSTITPTSEVTLTATVTGPSGSTTPPTGKVYLWDAYTYSTTVGSLVPGSGATSTASIQLMPNDLASLLTNLLSASYSGDSVYNSSFSSPITLKNTGGADYAMTLQSQSLAVTAGQSGTATINLSASWGFNGAITFTCLLPSGLNATCSINPNSLTVNGNTTVAVTVNAFTTTTTTSSLQRGHEWMFTGGGTVLALCFCFGFRRRRFASILSLICITVLAVAMSGCSASSKSSVTTTTQTNAAKGTYVLTVTGTGYNGMVHNANLTVVIQ